jgi:hypothetical protein
MNLRIPTDSVDGFLNLVGQSSMGQKQQGGSEFGHSTLLRVFFIKVYPSIDPLNPKYILMSLEGID